MRLFELIHNFGFNWMSLFRSLALSLSLLLCVCMCGKNDQQKFKQSNRGHMQTNSNVCTVQWHDCLFFPHKHHQCDAGIDTYIPFLVVIAVHINVVSQFLFEFVGLSFGSMCPYWMNEPICFSTYLSTKCMSLQPIDRSIDECFCGFKNSNYRLFIVSSVVQRLFN